MQPIKQSQVYGGGNPIRGGGFDPQDSRYACCCGRMDARRGAFFVGVVHIISALIAILSLIIAFVTLWERNYGIQLLVSVGSISIGICICLGLMGLVVAMFLGLRAGAPVLILPHFITQFFILVGLIFSFIVSIVTLIGLSGAVFGPDRYSTSLVYVNDHTLRLSEALTSCTLVLSFIGFIVECWFVAIVGAAYRYFVDELKYRG